MVVRAVQQLDAEPASSSPQTIRVGVSIVGQGPASLPRRRNAARYQLIIPVIAPGRWASLA